MQGCLFFPLCLIPVTRNWWQETLVARNWEGTLPGQLTKTGQRAIPYHIIKICSIIQHRVRRELASKVTIVWRPAGPWSALEGGDCVTLLCFLSPSPIKPSLSWSVSFSLLFFLFSSHPNGWGVVVVKKWLKQLCGYVAARWGQSTKRKYSRSEMPGVILSFQKYRHMLSNLTVQSRDSQQRNRFEMALYYSSAISLCLPEDTWVTCVNASILFHGKVKNCHATLPSAVAHQSHLPSPWNALEVLKWQLHIWEAAEVVVSQATHSLTITIYTQTLQAKLQNLHVSRYTSTKLGTKSYVDIAHSSYAQLKEGTGFWYAVLFFQEMQSKNLCKKLHSFSIQAAN